MNKFKIINKAFIDSVNDGDMYCGGRAVIEKTETACYLVFIDTMTQEDIDFVNLRKKLGMMADV